MIRNLKTYKLFFGLVLLKTLLFFLPVNSMSAVRNHYAYDTEEVLLTFRYRGIGSIYITGLYDYDADVMFLPVTELFSRMEIFFEPSPGDFTISGSFLTPNNTFRIFFNQHRVTLNRETFEFTPDDFRIGEVDFFMSPKVFEEVFGLFFTINLNLLTLSLETVHTLPVEERAERERRRRLIEAREVTRQFYPLEQDRNRRVLGVGFADYNITGNFAPASQSMNYNLIGGIEFMGGDLQGTLTGNLAGNDHQVRSSGLRWRYVVRNNPWFSAFSAGQLNTTGLQPRNIRGASISNRPVEPRRLYESYIIDGYTDPDSEVELYLNNRLIDFSRADASGYYRFEFPITYGTSRITINIYTPTGETRSVDRQLQIPFTFLPPGEAEYNIQAGLSETFLGGEDDEEKLIVQGDVAYGITSWLTAKVGSEYIQDIYDERPFFYGGLSARVFSQYLVNVDIAPDAFYRGITSVMFPSGRSLSLQYTYYDGESLFNMRGASQDVQAHVFVPFTFLDTPMGVRVGADHSIFPNSSLTRYRTDFTVRIGRMNVRMNYRDALFYSDDTFEFGQGQINGSLTYTFMRSPGLPVFVRGMFLRGNVRYRTASNQFDEVSLQLSRSIRQWGRINMNAGYDLQSRQHLIRLGFTADLTPVRATTNVDVRGDRTTVRQNFRGSLGFDRNPDRVIPTNRNQVGRAAASVILFRDINNSGTFDEGDEIIPARAVRLDRSAQMAVGRDGILRIGQLQSYFQYNLEVMRHSLPNPMLAPGRDRFSFVTDPNRYKRIEIPFYTTGVIDGTVYVLRNGEQQTQGGLRLFIKGVSLDYEDMVRNFSDGSYYAMDLPPGQYTIEVDPLQLSFLDVQMKDGPVSFEIRALSEGDFIENLDIFLSPIVDRPVVVTRGPEPDRREMEDSIAALSRKHIRLYVSAQNAYYENELEQAMEYINAALDIFDTDLAIALKGTLLYMTGRRQEGLEYWEEANRRNPDIRIPDLDLLERVIRVLQ